MRNKVKMNMEFIEIPEGSFFMGADDFDEEADGNERPPHQVWLSEYKIQKTPVTVGQWKVFLQETNYQWSIEECTKEIFEVFEQHLKNTHPITFVSWFDSCEFIKWLSIREGKNYSLPTEAQWEKACRGTDKRRYPSDYRHDFLEEGIKFYPVGSTVLNASPYGCLDMSGRVFEWCSDWYDIDYYEYMPVLNPKGPSKGICRSARGSSIFSNSRCCRRGGLGPDERLFCGFRMVLI
jgi:formylglycine-generating enzyme required for sulfatase activity